MPGSVRTVDWGNNNDVRKSLKIYLFLDENGELYFSRPDKCCAWWRVRLPETADLDSDLGRGIIIVYEDCGLIDDPQSLFWLIRAGDYPVLEAWDPENFFDSYEDVKK